MQKYLRMHIVEAEPMTLGQWETATGKKWNEADRPRTDDGYKCNYPDGYTGWCPKQAFEEVSRPIDGMTFGMAIEHLKRGKRVARKGWNGKGMWIYYVPANRYPANRNELSAMVGVFPGDMVPYQSYIAIKNAQNVCVPWVPCQSDILGEDWVVVE